MDQYLLHKIYKNPWFCANVGSENSEAKVLNHKNDHLFPHMHDSYDALLDWEVGMPFNEREKKQSCIEFWMALSSYLWHNYPFSLHYPVCPQLINFIIICHQCHSTMNFFIPNCYLCPLF